MKDSKYKFYLNPHFEYKWTKCPNCDDPTRVRKFCLVNHYKEKANQFHQLLSINKSCKYCPKCDLIICQKIELEKILSNLLEGNKIIFNQANYSIFGTMEKKDWLMVQQKNMNPREVLNLTSQFKDILDFEIRPAGWYRDED
jgi:Zn-finger nucleic acid-binding protein